MARIPEETIQQIIAATDIVDVIGRYVKLKRAGTNHTGLCPFHTEKSPSFSVSSTRRAYHCFGCGAGGTVIRFLMEHDGLPFIEAARKLGEAAGIRIEEEVWDANAEREAKHRSALKRLHEDIAAWYHSLLLKHEMADAARQYLKSRGVTSAVAKNWMLGFAPEQDMWVRRWAAEKKYSDQLLVDAGIFILTDDHRTYSRFRNRMMIPIRNESGECIGFSGRLLAPDAKAAKYLNSPETVLFSKSKVLFGFDKSKRAIGKDDRVIVCEGQLDTITVFESGVQNVVGTQGTAFTEFHAKVLKRQCSEVVLCFDSDNAGYKAAERSFQILSPAGLNVKVAKLPAGEDPDSFVKKFGADAFRAEIEKAVDFLDFQIKHKRATLGNDLKHQVQLVEQTAVTIAMSPSISKRDMMIRSHANQLGVSEDALRKEVNNFVRRQLKNPQQGGQAAQNQPRSAVEEAKRMIASQNKTGLLLCKLALSHVEVLEWLRHIDLEELLRDLPGNELLGRVWHAHFAAGDEAAQAAFFATLSAEEEAAFAQLLAQPMPAGGLPEAQQAWVSMGLTRLQHLIQQTQAQMNDPNLSSEKLAEMHERVMAWRKECLDLTRPA